MALYVVTNTGQRQMTDHTQEYYIYIYIYTGLLSTCWLSARMK